MRTILLTVFCLIFAIAALADGEVGTTEHPAWSKTIPLEPFPGDRSGKFRYGIAYLLSDRQIRKTDEGFDYVSRLAYEVIDRSGLEEAARISATFDPTNESLDFNFVRILRDGKEIDRLSDAEITVLRQEEGLDNSLIDGSLTALIQLEDVRVGDIVDYSFSGSVASKLWPAEFFWTAQVDWSVPLAQMRFQLSVPDELAVTTRSIATGIAADVERKDGWTTYTVHVRDPEPVRIEQNLPDDYLLFGLVAFTTMEAWSDVVDWATPLFAFDEPLPADFVARLDEIAATYEKPEERATHALRLVQSDIRYLGIEIGLGSHVPRAPAVTLERGYGDCKDKSVLLVEALEYLGIDAVPALASIANGDTLPKFPPSIDGFDHVIVAFDVDGRTFWVDPTLTHQGGIGESLVAPDYGFVLPIRAGQTELARIDVPVPELPTLEIAETFELPASDDAGLNVRVEYTYRGPWADATRLRIVNSGQDSLALSFLDYYAANWAGLAASRPLSIEDDLEANVIVIRAEYAMDAETLQQSGYAKELPMFAIAVQDEIPRQVEAQRSAPLGLPYGSSTRHTIRVRTPGERLPLPDDKSKSVAGISYARSFEHEGDGFVLDYTLVVSEALVEPAAIRAAIDLADEIADDSEMTVHLDNDDTAEPDAPSRPQLGLDLDPSTESAVTRINGQIEEEEYVAALTGLNSLLAGHTDPTDVRGYLLARKAIVLVKLGRRKAAIRPFREAFELYEPSSTEPYFRYMDVLRREGDLDESVDMMARLFENHPEAIDSLNIDWMFGLWRALRREERVAAKEKMSLVVARALLRHEVDDVDEFAWIIMRAVENLGQNGNAEEAAKYLPHLKDPVTLALILTRKDYEALWTITEEHAGEGLSKAIANYVAYTRLAANLAPEDFTVLRRHLTALRIATRYEDAIDFAALFLENWPRIEAVGKDAYWFVNEAAYALSSAGKADEALALMTRLVDLGVEENGDLVSIAINRAAMLMHWGRFEKALEAIEELENLGDEYTNNYGMMWIYEVKACSLHQLGRRDEAQQVLENSMAPIADRNQNAHTKTLLCLDQTDTAADLMVERLQDPRADRSLILSFSETPQYAIAEPFLEELETRSERVRARPDVRAAFDAVGRAIRIDGARTNWGEI